RLLVQRVDVIDPEVEAVAGRPSLQGGRVVVLICGGNHQDDRTEPDLRVNDGADGTVLTCDDLKAEGTEPRQRGRRVLITQVGEERRGDHDKHPACRGARRRVRSELASGTAPWLASR